jgi:hypothetical protein
MFIKVTSIRDWMVLKFDPQLYKSRSLTQNVARLCVSRRALQKIPMPRVIEELKGIGIPDGDVLRFAKTYVEFALPFHFEDEAYAAKMTALSSALRDAMTGRFGALFHADRDCLQSRIVHLMQNADFRLSASIHHASRHGHEQTLHLLETIDCTWS